MHFFSHPVCHISHFNQASPFSFQFSRMQERNYVKGFVALSACLPVYLSVCPSVCVSIIWIISKIRRKSGQLLWEGWWACQRKAGKRKIFKTVWIFLVQKNKIKIAIWVSRRIKPGKSSQCLSMGQSTEQRYILAYCQLLHSPTFFIPGRRNEQDWYSKNLCLASFFHVSHSVNCTHFCDPW